MRSDFDLGWLVGLLDGEGTFVWDSSPTVEVTMTDEDTIQRAAELFGSSYWRHHPPSAQDKGWQVTYRTRLRGSRAIRLMDELYPHLSQRRQRQVAAVIGRYVLESNLISHLWLPATHLRVA